MWLQGGPGGSSLFGLFVENGPLSVAPDSNSAQTRDWTWAKNYHVIYIDNPVGTGFSFTNDTLGLATNEVDVARDLFEGLQQFFTLFSELQKNEFYLTGESYAGKYLPAIGYKIHTEGKNALMNLQGLAIGDGLTDPETQFDYAELLYYIVRLQRGFLTRKTNR